MSVVMITPGMGSSTVAAPVGDDTEATVIAPFAEAPSGRVLIVADESSIGDVRALVAQLQSFQTRTTRTRGQVFIEIASGDDIEFVDTPELMTVTWLVRSARSGAPGTGEPCRAGVALDRAVRAWVSEMSTGDVDLDGGDITAVVFGADASGSASGSAAVLSDLRLDLISHLGVVSAG